MYKIVQSKNYNLHLTKVLQEESSCSTDDDVQTLNSKILSDGALSSINTTLNSFGHSPVKFRGLPSSSKRSYGKRKVNQASTCFHAKISRALNLNPLRSSGEYSSPDEMTSFWS